MGDVVSVQPSTKKDEVNQPVAEEKSNEVQIAVLTEGEEQQLKLSNLEQLQQQQKLIEEQNKKKQSMIQQTLQERFKQAQSESVKLKQIHKQLQQVDAEFRADVDGLREKIDEACILFSHAQRRYEKAEKEYVESKLDFHTKKDRKDELTEQLYAIIQENEIKKAKKLEKLMSKLATDSVSLSPESPEAPAARAQETEPSSPGDAINGQHTPDEPCQVL